MPQVKITKSFVDQVPFAEKGQVAYCDTELSGFYLLVGQRAKTYVAQRDMRGRSVRYTIGRHGHFTSEQARKIAQEKLYTMASGVNPVQKEREEEEKLITLEAVFENYMDARRSMKQRTKDDYRYMIGKYLADWKEKSIAEIFKEMIVRRHQAIGEKHGFYVANKTMRILRVLYNHAYATFDVCPVNPVSYLTKVKAWYKEHRRRTYIKPHELKDWWQAVHALENDTYRDFLLVLLFTGLRRSEAAKMRWADIDFKDKTFMIPDTKNGDALTLPMSEFLCGLLEQRRKRYGNYEFVFPGPGQHGYLAEPKKGVYKVIERCGVQFTCHDMRRTFITIAESLDISAYALKRLINHRVTDVTGGYIIVDVERLREPAQRVAGFILERVA